MRYWIDTEFVEKPCTIDLISIGIVAEDGRDFYAESSEVDWSQASDWVLTNVRPHLIFNNEHIERDGGDWYDEDFSGRSIRLRDSRTGIASEVRSFMRRDTPEIWGYYGAYDWVVFCWLFGSMVDLPSGWPMMCRDVKQWALNLGDPALPPQTSTEHHALADARWTRDAWHFLADYERHLDVRAYRESVN